MARSIPENQKMELELLGNQKAGHSIAFGPTPIGPGHPGTDSNEHRTGAMVRHEDKQLDSVGRVPK
jgi:hypothetical protein